MIRLDVKGLAEFRGKVRNLERQIKHAASQALNDAAKAVQAETLDKTLPGKFTLRSKGAAWWKPGQRFGINIQFAKRDNLTAIVGSNAPWLETQEQGGFKTAQSGKSLAIPLEGAARPSARQVIPSSLKPRRLLQRKRRGGVIIQTAKGSGIFQKDEEGHLKLFYWFRKRAQVQARFGFRESARKVAEKILPAAFMDRLNKALSTAK